MSIDTPATFDEETIARITHLLDKHAIIECTQRYARGVDRLDEALIQSVFHEDAQIRERSRTEFFAYIEAQREVREACQHYVTNQTIDLDGDVAHSETYFISVMKMKPDADPAAAGPMAPEAKGDDEIALLGGRYIDRFEKRDGVWKIAVRVGISEWLSIGDGSRMKAWMDKRGGRARDRSDLSYQRPLVVPED